MFFHDRTALIKLLISSCLLLFFSGCGGGTSTATLGTTPTSPTPTIAPISTPSPTSTPISTATIAPAPVTCGSAFSGTFDSPPLDHRWHQMPASGGSIVIDSTAHFVGISSPSHTDLYGTTFNASRMLQPIGGDFTINTNVLGIELNVQPGVYQGGGLLLWQDTTTYARLEVGSFDGTNWGVEFDVDDHGSYHRVALATSVSVDDPATSKLTLQLQRTGRTLSASLRPPISGHYTPVGSYTFTASFTSLQVGLDVVNATSSTTTEAFGFEWFVVHCP